MFKCTKCSETQTPLPYILVHTIPCPKELEYEHQCSHCDQSFDLAYVLTDETVEFDNMPPGKVLRLDRIQIRLL